jgi:hypothetical protein
MVGPVRSGKGRLDQVGSVYDKLGHIRSGYVRFDQFRSF